MTVLVPGAVFHLYAACKSIDQEDILQKPVYTVFYIISVLLRITLEVVAFWLQSHLFGFQVNPIFKCDAGSLDKKYNVTRCMVPEHFEKTIFLIAMYTFTVITIILCVAEIFEILCRRLGFLNTQWPIALPTTFIFGGKGPLKQQVTFPYILLQFYAAVKCDRTNVKFVKAIETDVFLCIHWPTYCI